MPPYTLEEIQTELKRRKNTYVLSDVEEELRRREPPEPPTPITTETILQKLKEEAKGITPALKSVKFPSLQSLTPSTPSIPALKKAVKPLTKPPISTLLTGGLAHPKEAAQWLPFGPKYEWGMGALRKKIFGVETFRPAAEEYLPDWLVGGLMPTDLAAEILPKLIGKPGETFKKLRAEELKFRKQLIGGMCDIYTRPDVLALNLFPKIAKQIVTRPIKTWEHNLLQRAVEPVRQRMRVAGVDPNTLFTQGTLLQAADQKLVLGSNLSRVLKGMKIRVPRFGKINAPLARQTAKAIENAIVQRRVMAPGVTKMTPLFKPKAPQELVILARWKQTTPRIGKIPEEEIMRPVRTQRTLSFEEIEALGGGITGEERIAGALEGVVVEPEEEVITQIVDKPTFIRILKQSKLKKPKALPPMRFSEFTKLSKARQAYEIKHRTDISEVEAVRISDADATAFFEAGGGSPLEFAKQMQEKGGWSKVLHPKEEPKLLMPVPGQGPPVGLSMKKVVPPEVTIIEAPPDLVGFKGWMKSWIYPVRHVAKLHPTATQIARWGRDAMLHLRHMSRVASNQIESWYKGLSKEQKKLTVERLDREVSQEEYDAFPQKEKEAYIKNREYLLKIKELARHIKGVNVEKWSISDDAFFPHIFVGSYQIMDGAKTFAFGRTIGDSLDKAQEYLKTNPDADIKIKPKDIGGDYTATMLSRKGFWKFISAVSKETEMDRDEILSLMKGVAAVKPRGKFVGSFERRMANLGGFIDDPVVAMKIYTHRIFRKLVLDPFKRKAAEKAMTLPAGLREYFMDYIDDVSGKYDPLNNRFQMSRALSAITKSQAFLKLGYRLSSALVNRLQPFHTTYAEIGNYLFRGMYFKRTPLGEKVVNLSEALLQPPKYYALEQPMVSQVKFYEPLYFFATAESANRGDSVAGGYLFGDAALKMPLYKAKKLGYDYILNYLDNVNEYRAGWLEKNPNVLKELEEQFGITGKAVDRFIASVEYAKDVVADTQYVYDVSDLSRLLRTRAGRVVFQFKNYTINTLIQGAYWIKESLTNPTPHNIARTTRLIASNVALGGVKLPLFFLRQAGEVINPFRHWYKKVMLALLGAILLNKQKNRDVTVKALNTIYRGVFSILGVDLSERIAPDVYVPRNALDWFGPTAGDLYRIGQMSKVGKPIQEILLSPWLLGRRMYEVATKEHIKEMRRDRTVLYVTPWEKFLYALGFLPPRLADSRTLQSLMLIDDAEYTRLRAVYSDKIIAAMERGAPEEKIDSIYQDAAEKGVYFKSGEIDEELAQKHRTGLYRRFRQTPRARRAPYEPFLDEETNP